MSADAVVNLAGEPIAEGRWTDARKQACSDSRILATRLLVDVLAAGPSPFPYWSAHPASGTTAQATIVGWMSGLPW